MDVRRIVHLLIHPFQYLINLRQLFFDDPAISIVIGAACMNRTIDVWKRIDARQKFNQEVGFYPAATNQEENR